MIAIAHPRPLRPPGAHLLLAGQAIGALAAAVDVADQVVRPFGAAADAHSSRPRGGQDRGRPPRGRGPLGTSWKGRNGIAHEDRAFRTCDLLDFKVRRTMGLPDPCC